MISCTSRFYRVSLTSDADKRIYDNIVAALESRILDPVLPSTMFIGTELPLQTIISYVHMDNPGLFYADFNHYSVSASVYSGDRKIIFPMLFEPDEIDRIEKKLTEVIRRVVEAGTAHGLRGYGMELYLHDYLARNVRYEYIDRTYHKAHSSVGALLHGRAVCEGYALAFRLLCDAAGISCISVFGTGLSPGKEDRQYERHAWNIVKLNRKCYQVDVTWDSCRCTTDNTSHTYFNLTDSEMALDHVWDTNLFPACRSEDDNYFMRNGALLEDDGEIRHYVASGLDRGIKSFCFRIRRTALKREGIVQVIRSAFSEVPYYRKNAYSYTYTFDETHKEVRLNVK